MRLRFNKSDRVVLILLVVLILSYVLYSGITAKGLPIPTEVQDTIPPGVAKLDTAPPAPVEKEKSKSTPAPIRTDRYPGPPPETKRPEAYLPKLKPGATIDLNTADTTLLKRVPGIGSSFARRIVKYRDLLGGYYVVEQLQEVYGMDRERYDAIYPYFTVGTAVRPLTLTIDSISYHPYLSWRHKRALRRLLEEEQTLDWSHLMATGDFTRDDSLRLAPYMPF
ncbi:MAG: helix-hairpin-helix domain-containing protein [Porphyromonas sp.]|uniref:ComEA family DNA-binding protein n=1 Tax=Porphyromonas sp. TaxID=1924944 RepID=UPI002A909DD2|nr:helix-hairpin-helix domain-containing protein [Porphyromonas sp.]MDD7468736.1 helix-hairpin-helix domain-containing protein [Bacteroidales bacterium]MDY6102390.1 helix-hairpin-helix domain-containing protein [Porphyromonas sp.]